MNNPSRKSGRGAVMVEFAIIVPILVLIVFGITELGRALYQWNTLTKSVATGTRYMARANGDAVNPDCSEGANWAGFRATAENLITTGQTAAGGDPLLNAIAINTFEINSREFTFNVDDTKTACVINVIAQAQFNSIFTGLIPIAGIGSITLTARTEERYIGE